MKKSGDDKKNKFFTRKRLLKFFLNIFFITILVFITKLFFIESIIVSNIFMEGTIHKGDFILINKSAYQIKTPEKYPFFDKKNDQKVLIDVSLPKIGDLLYVKLNHPNLYNLENLLTRCVGLPGDTLLISDKILFVNNEKLEFTKNIEHSRNYSIPFGVEEKEFYFNNLGWNQDNFGPIIIPKKGDRIKLTLKNIQIYKSFIYYDDNKSSVKVKDNRIYINNKAVIYYHVKNDYYFVLGDNRDFAIDSRYIGYIKKSSIIGRAEIVFWSLSNYESTQNKSFSIGSVKWERIFNVLK